MGEISYRPIIETMTWSYSRIESFDSCPYKWFLTYIHTPKLPKEEKFYATYGLFMHELLEKYYKGECGKTDVLIMFLTHFPKITQVTGKPKPSIIHNYFTVGKEFIKGLKPFEYETVSVEEIFKFKIDGIPFTGRVDYLGLDNGEYVIVDNKSRSLKPRSSRKKPTLKDKELDTMLRQLYLYSEGVRQKYGKLPTKLCFNCFKTGIFIEEKFNNEAYVEALSWAKKKIEKILDSDDFYPNMDFFFCNYLCDASEHCCYNQETNGKRS